MADQPIRVTVWHEHVHEKKNKVVADLYPDGMHAVMKAGIEEYLGSQVKVGTALLEQPEHGLTQEVLDNTDVLTWWGHRAHNEVDDEIVDRVYKRVLEGMGLIVLHSGHYAKIFKKLMGTGCGLKWREAAEKERLWVVNPGHPIVDGLDEYFELEHTEMYGELFDIPTPDELIFISWFEGGEVFRSGCTWTRGKGKVFYFRPGHETFPIYYDKNVRKVLANGVKYVAPRTGSPYSLKAPNIDKPLSPINSTHEVDESLHQH
ncbi:ThuA domain-containing protein [Phycisphaerales bacterium AB-hyl4]|uniref:ThuA domain-containing protein n=1 Tax=Natronomicrosphaera hydrolytica TaxID=3242702 RepID=A0ABV4U6G9_9BACT